MQESTLLRLALATSILGLGALVVLHQFFALTPATNPEYKTISGTVTQVFRNENITVFTLSYEETMDVVLFDDLELRPVAGMHLRVIGEPTRYEGEEELLAKELSVMP